MLWARVCLPPLRRDQPSATAPEAKMTLWWAGWLHEDFFVSHVVLPFDAKNEVQAALVKPLIKPDLLPVENPDLYTAQEDGKDDGSVYQDLRGEAERMTLPYFL